jgi:CubicO group peptidase (beta-lactamase class C family)
MTAIEQVGFSSERLARISTMLQGYVSRGELAGILATVARKGETVYRQKFGQADIEEHKPMTYETIFRIASMTKPVVCAALMMLYEEGSFNLNTPISRFIPAYKNTKVFVRETSSGLELENMQQEITFRHLFTHTSGMSYGWNELDPVDRAYQAGQKQMAQSGSQPTARSIAEALAELPLAFQPGTHWRYSMSIDVLGHLIEVISGLTLGEFLRKRMFEPLDMPDTGFYVPAEKAERVAAVYGHPDPDKPLQRLPIPLQSTPPSYESGGGGLFSTLHDYARFAQMLVNGGVLDGVRLLGTKTVALFSMNQAPLQALPYGFRENDLYHAGYGFSLGTRVLMDVAQTGLPGSVGEFGWDGAFSTYFWIDPVEKLYGLLMLQHSPNAFYPVAQQFKQLTYQALVGEGGTCQS